MHLVEIDAIRQIEFFGLIAIFIRSVFNARIEFVITVSELRSESVESRKFWTTGRKNERIEEKRFRVARNSFCQKDRKKNAVD